MMSWVENRYRLAHVDENSESSKLGSNPLIIEAYKVISVYNPVFQDLSVKKLYEDALKRHKADQVSRY